MEGSAERARNRMEGPAERARNRMEGSAERARNRMGGPSEDALEEQQGVIKPKIEEAAQKEQPEQLLNFKDFDKETQALVNRKVEDAALAASIETGNRLAMTYPTKSEVRVIAQDALGPLRGAAESIPTGPYLRLGVAGGSYFGPGPESDSAADFDWSTVALGYKINPDGDNPAEVRIYEGLLFHGTRTAITIPEASSIVLGSDNTYIYVTYTFGSGTAAITSSTIFPQNTETTLNWLKYKMRLSGEVASIGTIYHFGSIYIPGSFA